jgi:DNA-binding response OmpR family regulator
MMGNAGQILKKRIILDRIRGYYFDKRSNIIGVYANRLLAKMNKDFSTKLIYSQMVRYVIKTKG